MGYKLIILQYLSLKVIISGEFITEVQQGYPMLVRSIDR